MSKADKLFEQEGYTHKEQVDNLIKYEYCYPTGKDFVIIDGDSQHVDYYSSVGDAMSFNLLKAINAKVQELGFWDES